MGMHSRHYNIQQDSKQRLPWIACLLLLSAFFLITGHALGQPALGFNELGGNYFKEKRYAEALERFEQAHQLAPNNESIRRNICVTHQAMAKVAFAQKDMDGAIAHLEAAMAIDPGNPAPHIQAADYQLRGGHLQAAQKHLEDALALDPAQHEARALLGEIHYRKNELAQARKLWEQALKEKPDLPGLQEKLDKLHREEEVEAEFQSYTSKHFQIRYGKVLSEETRTRVFAILEAAYQDIGKALGGIYPREAVHVVLYDGNQFSEATQAKQHVGALFDGKIRAPITNKQGRFLRAPTLTSRLRHEYVHVVLHYRLGNKVPWWLNEGLAETLSRDLDKSRLRLLRTAYRGKKNFSFTELERNALQRLNAKQLQLAYAQAHVAVSMLWAGSGKDKFPTLFQQLRSGSTVEEALRKSFGFGYDRLARQTAEACKRQPQPPL